MNSPKSQPSTSQRTDSAWCMSASNLDRMSLRSSAMNDYTWATKKLRELFAGCVGALCAQLADVARLK